MIAKIILILALPFMVSSLNVTVCNCDEINKEEVYKLASSCSSILQQQKKVGIAYDYEIYTNHPETITYPCYLCSRWISQQTVSISWLNTENDTPLKTIALDTSEEQCRLLVETKTCGIFKMVFNEGRCTMKKGAHSRC